MAATSLDKYESRFYPQVSRDLRAKWNEIRRALAWPDWLTDTTWGAFVQAADNDVDRGEGTPPLDQWLSALSIELTSDQGIEPAEGYFAFAASVAALAEDALDAAAADAARPGWVAKAWKEYGEPLLESTAGVVAGEDNPIASAVMWIQDNPRKALAGIFGIVAGAGLVYTMGPALLLRVLARR